MNSPTHTSEQGSIVEAALGIRAEANIGKLLQDAGKLKPKDMERVLKLQQEQNLRFGEAAQKLGLVTDADIQQALSHQFEYPTMSAADASLSPELTAATAPFSKEAEALRTVRSELMLRWFREGRQTLAVGSANANEGASYLTANLAVLFAQMGRKVLLIDANMRQPHQHSVFSLANNTGLSEVLAERVSSVQVRAVKAFPTLSVLTAGSPPPNPAELLARPTFDALLSSLEASYDIILIDVAPSQLSSDFQQIVARVGGMLIAARRNVSRLAPLAELKEKITFTGAQVVGAVVLD
ncbi:chain length determinant protein tyrosine kinase EpsG [Sulfuriferula sp.]|uniref:chain length determinant protein tyrosine kinase EpsG n=1 Tax=Sulfuriferula sp. TaxID=2025307 RepID=UPI002730745F|nr:chain length determinant protein tyrosine kinase EpsG [Sulfuriferula sp.]MDP2025562.1 chain length determinant protein tyrosine kinase EpsG [Sulfuriferula sp.]